MTPPPWMNRTKEMDKTKPMDTATPKDGAVDEGRGQSPPPLGTTSALAVPEKERPVPSMGDGREGHPLILPPDIAQKYGDKDLILPDWWTSPYTAMPHDFPKGSGYGYIQSPYTSWWTRIYGVSPISDLPKYRYMYRNVPEIKAAIDKTVFLSVARGMDLKLPKDDAVQGGPAQGAGAPKLDANGKPIAPPFGKGKAPPFGQKDGEPGTLGEGGAPPEENEPGQEQGQEAVTPEGEPAPGEAEVVKGKPRPFGAADLPFPKKEQDTPPEEHPFLKDAPEDEVGNLPPEGEPQGQAPNPKVPGPEEDKALAVRGPGGLAIPKPKTKNQQIIEFLDDFLGSINWIDIQVQALTDMLVYGNAWVELAYDGQKALERNLKPDEAKDIENYSKPAPEGYKPGPDNKVVEIKGEGKVWDMKLLDPLFMRVRRDSLGNVYGAIQWLAWPPVVFSNDKVVHVAYNRKSWAYENAYGTSQLMSLIRVQDMIWQLESDMMAVSHINIAPALTIYGGTPERPYTNQQMGGLIDDMDARGPASNIFLKGDCKAEALPLIAQLGGISQFFTYLKDQRIILLGVPPDLMGIEMPGSYSKSAVSIAEFKARVKALQEVWGNALHDFIFPRILRPVFGDDCPIPKCVWKSPFEEDRTQTSNRVREDYKLGLITKRVALQEAGYDCDPSDPDLDEFYKPPALPPGMGGEQFEDENGNPAMPAGTGPDGEPVDEKGQKLKRKPPPFGGPPGQGGKPPFGKAPGKGIAGQPPPGANEDFGKPNAPYKAASNAGTLVYLSKLAENYGFQIYLVNSEYIAKNIDPRWDAALGKGHLIGGHHWALGMLYIPVDEIWISNAVPSSEREFIMLHELTEAPLMKGGMSYGDAHKRATEVEETAKSLTKSIRDFNYGIGDMSDGSFRASEEAGPTEQGVPFFAYDPDQARDESGKWTSDGGGGDDPPIIKEMWDIKNKLQEAKGSERFYGDKYFQKSSELSYAHERLEFMQGGGVRPSTAEDEMPDDLDQAIRFQKDKIDKLNTESLRVRGEYEQAGKDVETYSRKLDEVNLKIKGGTPVTVEELEAPIIPEGTAEPRGTDEFKDYVRDKYKADAVAYYPGHHWAVQACENYVGSTYGNMRKMCLDEGYTISTQEQNYAVDQIEGLDKYIKDNPNKEPVSLYRGMSMKIEEFTPGATFTSKAFGSFSTDERVAADFVSGQGKAERVLLHVVAPAGAQVTPTIAMVGPHNDVMFNTQERKYVAARGYQLRVISKDWNQTENRWTVRCKWVGVKVLPVPARPHEAAEQTDDEILGIESSWAPPVLDPPFSFEAFDPDQPRDESGRWTDGGGLSMSGVPYDFKVEDDAAVEAEMARVLSPESVTTYNENKAKIAEYEKQLQPLRDESSRLIALPGDTTEEYHAVRERMRPLQEARNKLRDTNYVAMGLARDKLRAEMEANKPTIETLMKGHDKLTVKDFRGNDVPLSIDKGMNKPEVVKAIQDNFLKMPPQFQAGLNELVVVPKEATFSFVVGDRRMTAGATYNRDRARITMYGEDIAKEPEAFHHEMGHHAFAGTEMFDEEDRDRAAAVMRNPALEKEIEEYDRAHDRDYCRAEEERVRNGREAADKAVNEKYDPLIDEANRKVEIARQVRSNMWDEPADLKKTADGKVKGALRSRTMLFKKYEAERDAAMNKLGSPLEVWNKVSEGRDEIRKKYMVPDTPLMTAKDSFERAVDSEGEVSSYAEAYRKDRSRSRHDEAWAEMTAIKHMDPAIGSTRYDYTSWEDFKAKQPKLAASYDELEKQYYARMHI